MARRYTHQEKEIGLRAVALCDGNDHRAARLLADKEDAPTIPRATLQKWRLAEPDRYNDIRERVVPEIQTKLARQSEALATKELELRHELVDRLEAGLDDLAPKDMARTVKELAISGGIDIDKAAMLRGKPTTVIEHRKSPEESLEMLRRLIPGAFVESTAAQLPAAQEPPESKR